MPAKTPLPNNDPILRAHGFRIFARPHREEPTWIRHGRKYPQSKALRVARAEQRLSREIQRS